MQTYHTQDSKTERLAHFLRKKEVWPKKVTSKLTSERYLLTNVYSATIIIKANPRLTATVPRTKDAWLVNSHDLCPQAVDELLRDK